MSILLVDDEPESRTLLTAILTAEGYSVRPADGGKLALASIAVKRPELILLDIRMPGMDGFEVCRHLKENPETKDIPLIFLSGRGEIHERVEGFKLGAVDFVVKPFQREELLARVRTHLELGRLRADLERQVVARTTELRESEERFRTMADAAPVLIWASGVDKLCTFFNKGWLEFTGRSLEQELGSGWATSVHPHDLERCVETYASSFDEHRSFEMEYRLRRADGEYRWIFDRGVPRFAPGGVFQGYVGSCIDITDLKRAHEEELDRQKLETIGALAAGISHDFNNLLGSIIVDADAALSEPDTGPPPLDEIQRIKDTAFRASEIVRQLLIYTGHETAEFETVDVSLLVEEMVKLLELSISKHATIETNVGKNLPPITGHAAQIRQVLMNLILNASEALGEKSGVITVTTSRVTGGQDQADRTEEWPEGDWIKLEVSDTGSGMTEEKLDRIFDPYFTTKSGGRGLGLAVVQGIVRAHGGLIRVMSAIDRQTTFQILLPCAQEILRQEHGPAIPGEARNAWSRGSVMIVEDEELLRTSVSKMLRMQEFAVVETDNGSAAIDLLRDPQQAIDVLLLDLTIPGATSREVVEEARRARPHVKIVLTSAYSEAASNVLQGPQVVAFIRKPFELSALVQLLRETLASDGSGRFHSRGAD